MSRDEREHGSRTSKTRRDVRTSESRDIEEILLEDITRIYIKKVFIRHRALSKIISDRDLRFVVVF